jgi:hypothetical protein
MTEDELIASVLAAEKPARKKTEKRPPARNSEDELIRSVLAAEKPRAVLRDRTPAPAPARTKEPSVWQRALSFIGSAGTPGMMPPVAVLPPKQGTVPPPAESTLLDVLGAIQSGTGEAVLAPVRAAKALGVPGLERGLERAEADLAARYPQPRTLPGKVAASLPTSLGILGTSAAAGLVGGPPAAVATAAAGTGVLGLSEGEKTYRDLTKKGVPSDVARRVATVVGASESGTEALSTLIDLSSAGVLGKVSKPLLRTILTTTFGEMGPEFLNTAIQSAELRSGARQAGLDPGQFAKPPLEAMREQAGPIIATSALLGSATSAVGRAAMSPAERLQEARSALAAHEKRVGPVERSTAAGKRRAVLQRRVANLEAAAERSAPHVVPLAAPGDLPDAPPATVAPEATPAPAAAPKTPLPTVEPPAPETPPQPPASYAGTAQRFKEQVRQERPDITEEQVDTALQAWEAPARRAGMSLDEWIARRFPEGPVFSGQPGKAALRQVDTQSPEFRRWFGTSFVRKNNGRPKVVYHGTPRAGFDTFQTVPKVSEFSYGPEGGAHFGNARQANTATRSYELDAVLPPEEFPPDFAAGVYPVYLSIKKPLRLKVDPGAWTPDSVAEALRRSGMPAFARYLENRWQQHQQETGVGAAGERRFLHDWLEEAGFDGVEYPNEFEGKGTSYMVLRPEQVKSVFNRGTFDPNDPRILYQEQEQTDATPESAKAGGMLPKTTAHSRIWLHGSPRRFSARDITLGRGLGEADAIWLTSDRASAESYARKETDVIGDGWVYQFRLRPDARIADLDMPDVRRRVLDEIAPGNAEEQELWQSVLEESDPLDQDADTSWAENLHSRIRALGYDGVSHTQVSYYEGEAPHTTLVVYNPQVLVPARGRRNPNDSRRTFQGKRGAPPKGAYEPLTGGAGRLFLFEKADVSTILHEFTHAYVEHDATPEDIAAFERWVGKPREKWGRAEHEKIARGLERYCAEGKAPTPKLRAAFERFRQWFADIYRGARYLLGDKLPDETRVIFDSWFAGGEEVAAPTESPAEAPEAPAAEPEAEEPPVWMAPPPEDEEAPVWMAPPPEEPAAEATPEAQEGQPSEAPVATPETPVQNVAAPEDAAPAAPEQGQEQEAAGPKKRRSEWRTWDEMPPERQALQERFEDADRRARQADQARIRAEAAARRTRPGSTTPLARKRRKEVEAALQNLEVARKEADEAKRALIEYDVEAELSDVPRTAQEIYNGAGWIRGFANQALAALERDGRAIQLPDGRWIAAQFGAHAMPAAEPTPAPAPEAPAATPEPSPASETPARKPSVARRAEQKVREKKAALREQAVQESAPAASPETPEGYVPQKVAPGQPTWMGLWRTQNIVADPDRFQFKEEVDAEGAGKELRRVRKWDPNKGGTLAVWYDPADGKVYVVNGHHRLALAKRLGVDTVSVRFLDAATDKEARTIGALINIAEGRGTAVDAAKVFRSKGYTPQVLEDEGVDITGKTAAEGLALANLSDDLFALVAKKQYPLQRAVLIGQMVPDHARQHDIVRMVEKAEKRGKHITDKVLLEVINAALAAGVVQKTEHGQGALPEFEKWLQQTNLLERAELVARIKEMLGRDKRLFGFVSKAERAARLSEGGNVINVEGSQAMADESARLIEVFNQLANRTGPIADALNSAATDWVNITNPAQRQQILEGLYGRIRQAVEAEVGAVQARTAGTEANAAGRNDQAAAGKVGDTGVREETPVSATQELEEQGQQGFGFFEQAPATRAEWERQVLAAYDAGKFTLDTPGLPQATIDLVRQQRPARAPAETPTVPPKPEKKAERPETEERVTTQPPGSTGIRHAYTEEWRAERGLPERVPQEPEGWEETFAQARTGGHVGLAEANAARAAEGATLTSHQQAGIALRFRELENERLEARSRADLAAAAKDTQALAEAMEQHDALLQQQTALVKGLEAAGSELGRSLNLRKANLYANFELAPVVYRAEKAKGEPLTPQERKEFESLVAKLQVAEDRIQSLEGDVAKWKAEAEAALKAHRAPKTPAERQASERKRLLERAKAVGLTVNASILYQSDPGGIEGLSAEQADVLYQFGKLLKDGGGTLEQMVSELREVFPTLTDLQAYQAIKGPVKVQAPYTPEQLKARIARADLRAEITHKIERLQPKSPLERLVGTVRDVSGTMRALMASGDLSAPLRQGAVLGGAHPFLAGRAAAQMLRAFGSENVARAIDLTLTEMPEDLTDPRALAITRRANAGLHLTSWTGTLNQREEEFLSHLVQRVPWVKASERAYVTYLNVLRASVFDKMANYLQARGLDTPKNLKAIANFVNVASGRGNLGKFAPAIDNLNALFFAPRYAVSRMQLPFTLKQGDSKTKRLIAQDITTWFLVTATAVGLLAAASSGEVERDPRSADFGQVRWGRTRLDLWAGFRPVAVLLARLASRQIKYEQGGQVVVKQRPWEKTLARYVQSKLSPIASLIAEAWSGKTYTYQDFSWGKALQERSTPIAIREAVPLVREHGVVAGGLLAGLGGLGAGSTVYDQSRSSTKRDGRSGLTYEEFQRLREGR